MTDQDYYAKAGSEYIDLRAARMTDEVQERRANKMAQFVSPEDRVLDFGCGNGGILQRLPCREKQGVEVSPEARSVAQAAGLIVHTSIQEAADASADVVISHHALEHVPAPYEIMCEMLRIVPPGGRATLVVPAENPRAKRFRRWYKEKNQHLYSWTPLTMGNLMTLAGWTVTSAEVRRIIGSQRLSRNLPSGTMKNVAEKALALYHNRFEVFVHAKRN